MPFPCRLDRGAYQLLPGAISTTSARISNIRRHLFLATSGLVGIGLVLLMYYCFFHIAYHPLDHYQKLDFLPMITDGYVPPSYPPSERAVVSALYTDSFAIGIAVLGHSVRTANVSARLVLMYLEGRVSPRSLCIARAAGWEPHAVPYIPPREGVHPGYRDQYTKLNIWSFDQLGIKNLVFLDGDTLVRRNFDELFDSPFTFAAVQDVYLSRRGWSSTFNAGVLVIKPSMTVFRDMMMKMHTAKFPPQNAEQAFLNLYYGGRGMRLPYIYNANLAIKNRSPPFWEAMKEEMRIVHYTMAKPFLLNSRTSNVTLTEAEQKEALRLSQVYADEVGWWNEAYERMQSEQGDKMAACLRV